MQTLAKTTTPGQQTLVTTGLQAYSELLENGKQPQPDRICAFCGKPFFGKYEQHYCSVECYHKDKKRSKR